jgi:hypothetical protein
MDGNFEMLATLEPDWLTDVTCLFETANDRGALTGQDRYFYRERTKTENAGDDLLSVARIVGLRLFCF